MLIAAAADSRRRVHLLTELWIAGVLISGLVAVLGDQGISIAPLSGIERDFWLEQAGLTVHPNMLGLASAMTLPIVIARLGTADWRRRVYYIAAIVILAGAIGASGSRIALVSGVLGVALVVFLSRATWKLAALVAAAAVLAIGAGFVVDLGSVPVVERLRYEGIVDERRVILFEQTWEAVEGRPILGYGFQNLRGTHDVYLQLLQAGGLLALLSFLFFAAGTLTVAFGAVGAHPSGRPPRPCPGVDGLDRRVACCRAGAEHLSRPVPLRADRSAAGRRGAASTSSGIPAFELHPRQPAKLVNLAA